MYKRLAFIVGLVCLSISGCVPHEKNIPEDPVRIIVREDWERLNNEYNQPGAVEITHTQKN